ncbi:copper-transporting ATPase [Secundilactobacillus oryzae JCM 18671]|uniref:P-type Cu(+) transporter n=1 Tax=Secundilactobacillus oryzae JCM 18671 TaxID=1291743 RepID=A0A081BGJ6_9LACO|nr:heavy metal translocating P-type ATPase [Secundilactobacillus oryzae]GAK47164.1 copper-transporting ATPase [Secundilactobacillus oryzae JCM 18671]
MEDMHMNHQMHDDTMQHGSHMMHMGNLKLKFWVSLILTIPVILMSPMMGMNLPFQVTFPGADYLVAVIGSILFFYGGYPFFSGARGELMDKKPAMMTLITMGITVAYLYSLYAVIANNLLHVHPMVMDFFWELATLIDIMLLGHWIEMNAVMKASVDVNQLAALIPKSAHLVKDNEIEEVPVSELQPAQLVEVRSGEQIPADGTIETGETTVNEALITGESKEVEKAQGDNVIGGALNGNGTFRFRVTKAGKDSYLAQIMNLVKAAQHSKSKLENRANIVAGYLFYAALTISLIAFVVWLLTANLAMALSIAVTVLVIACPHALGLAVPLVTARSTSIAATNGLLIQNRTVLEKINQVKYVLMDKTGTLTEGKFKVSKLVSLTDKLSDVEVAQLFAGLEASATHPLATGIIAYAEEHQIQAVEAQNVKQVVGVGIVGEINGTTYQIVTANYLKKKNVAFNQDTFKTLANKGNTVSYLVQGSQVIGLVAEADQIKSTAKLAIDKIKAMGIVPVMLTGDNELAAETVANQIGIKDVKAGLLPEEKQQIVNQYEQDGLSMFVGDGVNDAPSLAKASIGVAIGSGTDIAIDSADVVLVNSNPEAITTLIELEKATNRKMVQNLWWGAGYNILAIPLAAGILAPIGFLLNPMVGAVVMSLSTIIVAINAMTLRLK